MRKNNISLKDKFLRLLLVIGGIAAGLFISEIFLRVTHIKVENYIPRYYHTWDEYAENDITPNFPPTRYGLSYFKFLVWSNELGCFDKPYLGEKDYILLLGDSFAWGCAPFEYKYGTLIEKYLAYRVLKCGVSGYGTRQEMFKLKKIVENVKNGPRLVILSYFCGNDLLDDYLFPNRTVVGGYSVSKTVLKDVATGEKTVNPDSTLKEQVSNYRLFHSKKAPKDFIGKAKRWLLSQSAIYQVIRDNTYFRKMAGRVGLVDTPPPELQLPLPYIPVKKYGWLAGAWQEHLCNLKAIKILSDKYGAKLLIVIIPQKEQVYGFLVDENMRNDLDWEQPNRVLKKFADEEGIDCLDLTPHFRRYSDQTPRRYLDLKKDLYWPFDIHFSIRGDELAALLIAQHILDANIMGIPGADEKKKDIENKLIKVRADN